MPFLRYRQEDIVVPSAKPSACGRSFPLIDRIDGRRDDQLVLPGGRKVPPQAVYHVMIPVPDVRRWQVVQETPSRIVVRVEPREGFGPEAIRVLVETMGRLVGEGIAVEVVVVPAIEARPGEKVRAVNSKVRTAV
jgi:phenylacetate-CoA ligase